MAATVLLSWLFGTRTASGQTAAPSGPDFSREPFVIEEDAMHISFNDDGTGMRENVSRIRIQSESGLKQYSVLKAVYQGAAETITIAYVRVRKPDGTVVETPPDSVQDMPAAITREAPYYSDIREKHVSVKGLAVGDVLEAKLTWRLTKPLVPGQFWFGADLDFPYVVQRYVLDVTVPRSRAVKWSSSEGLTPATAEGAGVRRYTWTTSQLEPSGPTEEASEDAGDEESAPKPPKKKPARQIQMSSFESWEAVGVWYRQLSRPRVRVTPEIRAKAAELTREAKSEDAKARAIYDYVSSQIRYIGVAFGLGRYQPHDATEVLTNQYGDCKDKDTLLEALLSAAGVKAEPVLIRSSGKLDEAVPSPGQFDHVITALPSASGYTWLDTTAEVAPFGYLVEQLRDRKALVVPTEGAPRLVTTEATPPQPFQRTYRIDAELDETGTLKGSVAWSFEGDDTAVGLKSALRRLSIAQWPELGKYLSAQSGFGGDVTDFHVDSGTGPAGPLRWSYKYERKSYSDWENRRIRPPLPQTPMPLADNADDEGLVLGGPGELRYTATLKLPPGSEPQLPPSREIRESFAEFAATYEFVDGKLKMDRRLAAKTHKIGPAEYEAYAAFRKAVAADAGFFISLDPPARLTMLDYQDAIWDLPYSKNREAADAYDDARTEYQKKNPAGQVAALQRAVRLDPRFTRAWLWIGEIEKSQRKKDAALKAYRSAIENDTEEPLGYKVLAFNQTAFGAFDDAVDTWNRLLKVAPDDVDGLAGLGLTLIAAKRWKEAIAPLERAGRLDPGRKDVPQQLGLVYVQSGEGAKAVDVYRRVIASNPDPLTLNNAAYAFAEAGQEPELALEYAERAVRETEAATSSTSLSKVTEKELSLTVLLGGFWDTLGYVHSKQGRAEAARRYLEAAWTLQQSPIVGEHLAEAYDRLGRKEDARRLRRLAAAASRSSDPWQATRGGGPAKPFASDPTVREELMKLRTVALPVLTGQAASAEFYLLVAPGPKVLETKFVSGDAVLKDAGTRLKAAKIHQPFPDVGPTRIVRRGVVSCAAQSGCTLVFYPPDSVSAGR